MKKICIYCNNEFITSHNYKNHCSRPKCKKKYHHDKSYLKSKCPTCGIEFEYRKSKPKKYCSKKCAQSSNDVIEKMIASQKKTYIKNYGVDHPMKTPGVLSNFKKSMKEKYGVEHALQRNEFYNKLQETNRKRYGVENIFQLEENKNKAKEKLKSKEVREKIKKTLNKKYGREYYSQTDDYKNRMYEKTYKNLIINNKFNNITPNFIPSEFNGIFYKNKYEFICNNCNKIFTSYLDNGHIPRCPYCKEKIKSKCEIEVLNYINEIYDKQVIHNDRKILNGKELDIYLPDLKLAIEYDGIYWHSEISGNKDKKYHLNKTKLCENKGIQLIHIFETEWIYKKEIVKSILFNIINRNKDIIYARKCTITQILPRDKNKFLLENHIQGIDISKINLGLYYKNELVSAMTFSKSRFNKNYEWEISRYVIKKYTIIIGGANKLFKHFIKNYNPNSIITYADKRYFNGEIYKKMGFEFIEDTKPNYFYMKNNILYNRIKFQKHKLKSLLKTFDPKLTEWENMQLNGYDRIWDCGNKKFIWLK